MNRRSLLASSCVFLAPAFFARASLPPTAFDRIGPLRDVDANGLRLPDGFTSRVIARSGDPVADTGYEWHLEPDGGAVFPTPDGGWIYVSNSESLAGAGGTCGRDLPGHWLDGASRRREDHRPGV